MTAAPPKALALPETEVAGIAGRLTKAQQQALSLWPDAWMAASEVLHFRVAGNTASVLADKTLLERRSDPNVWGRSQYRLTPLGALVRAHLENPHAR